MTSYKELVQQIEGLQKKAEEVRKKELHQIITGINDKIAAYGLHPGDLKFGTAKTPAPAKKSRRTVEPKYRDPESGKTWTGRGRSPLWIVDAESAGHPRETFLIV